MKWGNGKKMRHFVDSVLYSGGTAFHFKSLSQWYHLEAAKSPKQLCHYKAPHLLHELILSMIEFVLEWLRDLNRPHVMSPDSHNLDESLKEPFTAITSEITQSMCVRESAGACWALLNYWDPAWLVWKIMSKSVFVEKSPTTNATKIQCNNYFEY